MVVMLVTVVVQAHGLGKGGSEVFGVMVKVVMVMVLMMMLMMVVIVMLVLVAACVTLSG
jgi:hypothetical protein